MHHPDKQSGERQNEGDDRFKCIKIGMRIKIYNPPPSLRNQFCSCKLSIRIVQQPVFFLNDAHFYLFSL